MATSLEACFGDLDALASFAVRYDLSYEHWYAAGLKWMETTTRFIPQDQRIAHVVGSSAVGFYFSENQLRHGAELLAWMKQPLPALEVVNCDGTIAASSATAARPTYCVKVTQVLRVSKSTVITVEADDQDDILAMIDEGSLDVPCADDDTFDVWSTDHATLENEIQELLT